jgi:hypothetical protein
MGDGSGNGWFAARGGAAAGVVSVSFIAEPSGGGQYWSVIGLQGLAPNSCTHAQRYV